MGLTRIALSFALLLIPFEDLQQPKAPSAGQAAPVEITFPSGDLALHGWVYKPEGAGPFPAVLWNHGSERLPGWLPQLGPLFTSKGYVFFIPHRRGQGRSAGSGEYIMDELEREAGRGPEARSRKLVELMEVHLRDQMAALEYLKTLPYVDARKIAVLGCSFGGIQTLLAAEKSVGLRAAIDFAGAAQTWRGSPDLRQRLLHAARSATVPVFFIQAENDYDISPSRQLAQEMEKRGRPHRVHIFPPFGKTPQEAHEFCVRGSAIWSPEVFAFLESSFKD